MGFEDENQPLFSGMDASEVLADQQRSIDGKIDSIPDAEFRAMSDDTIVEQMVTEGRVQPLTLVLSTQHLSENTVAAVGPAGNWCRLDYKFRPREWVRGVHVRVSVRYEGASNLWHFAPSSERVLDLRGNVEEESETSGWLHISLAVGGDDWSQVLKQRKDELFARISAILEAQRAVIDEWNRGIAKHARDAIQARRQHLKAVDQLPAFLEISLLRRDGRATYVPIQIRQRQVTPTAVESTLHAEPEYRIGAQGYEQILHVCRHFGRSFEGSPRPLRDLTEPEIRDLFLAALNTYFEGGASGERFRREGYTDVTIEERHRAAFVGEFKLWTGPADLLDALDQLLDYTTWRDSKCAIALFNRNNKDFAAVRQTIEATSNEHPAFRRRIPTAEGGEWRIVLGRAGDGQDEVTVHIFAFDIRTTGTRTRRARRTLQTPV